MTTTEKFLSEAETATILGCHPGTLHNWRRWLKGPPYVRQKVGSRRVIRYSEKEVRKWAKDTGWFKGAGDRRSRIRNEVTTP